MTAWGYQLAKVRWMVIGHLTFRRSVSMEYAKRAAIGLVNLWACWDGKRLRSVPFAVRVERGSLGRVHVHFVAVLSKRMRLAARMWWRRRYGICQIWPCEGAGAAEYIAKEYELGRFGRVDDQLVVSRAAQRRIEQASV